MQGQKQKVAKSRLSTATKNQQQQKSPNQKSPKKQHNFVDAGRQQRAPPSRLKVRDQVDDDDSDIHDIYAAQDQSPAVSIDSQAKHIQPDVKLANDSPQLQPGPKRQMLNSATFKAKATDELVGKNQDVSEQVAKMSKALKQGFMSKYQAMLDEKRNIAKEQIAKASSISLPGKVGTDARELSIENERLKSTLTVLNQKLNSQKDYEEQIDTIKKKNDELEAELQRTKDARNVLKNDNDFLHVKILNLEEELHKTKQELHETQQENIDLLEQLRDLEFQLQQAQGKIADLLKQIDMLQRNQAIYIPKKNDNIDLAISNFINKFPERNKMNILFLRESEGVYQFGKKRVYVKIEKGNQIQVRVGGGYMHIDQFIQQYTPLEVEKIERTNVIDRFSNKLQMQKISDLADGSHEQSPIRSPQRPRSVDKKEAMGMTYTSGAGRNTSRYEVSSRNPFGSPSSRKKTMKRGQKSPVTDSSFARQISASQVTTSVRKGNQPPSSPSKRINGSMPQVDETTSHGTGGRKRTMKRTQSQI